MNVLVIGASGLVGNWLFEVFSGNHRTVGTYYKYKVPKFTFLDLTNRIQITNLLDSIQPDAILCPAANPNVDYCESHPQETRNVNVKGLENLLTALRENEAKLVFFSSDYIFDGNDGPYSETDQPNPVNLYGKQKVQSEQLIDEFYVDYLIIRTTVVYGWERRGKNFVIRMLRQLSSGRSMKVPEDQVGTPTYANNLAKATKELVEKDRTGIYHIAGPDLMDRYTFAGAVADVFSLDKDLLIPVSTQKLGQRAARPLQAGLKIDKAQKALDTRLVGVKEGLEKMKRDLKRRGELSNVR